MDNSTPTIHTPADAFDRFHQEFCGAKPGKLAEDEYGFMRLVGMCEALYRGASGIERVEQFLYCADYFLQYCHDLVDDWQRSRVMEYRKEISGEQNTVAQAA